MSPCLAQEEEPRQVLAPKGGARARRSPKPEKMEAEKGGATKAMGMQTWQQVVDMFPCCVGSQIKCQVVIVDFSNCSCIVFSCLHIFTFGVCYHLFLFFSWRFSGLFSLLVSSCFGCVRVWIFGFGDFLGFRIFPMRKQFKREIMISFSREKQNVKSSWTSRMNSNMLRNVLLWCNRCMELGTRQRCGETTATA